MLSSLRERKTGSLFAFVSDRDSIFFREPWILAGFGAVRPHSCLVRTPVFSEIFSRIFGSRVPREEIWDSGKQGPDPTILPKRQQGCRTAGERIVRGGLERFFRAACSFYLYCRP